MSRASAFVVQKGGRQGRPRGRTCAADPMAALVEENRALKLQVHQLLERIDGLMAVLFLAKELGSAYLTQPRAVLVPHHETATGSQQRRGLR